MEIYLSRPCPEWRFVFGSPLQVRLLRMNSIIQPNKQTKHVSYTSTQKIKKKKTSNVFFFFNINSALKVEKLETKRAFILYAPLLPYKPDKQNIFVSACLIINVRNQTTRHLYLRSAVLISLL